MTGVMDQPRRPVEDNPAIQPKPSDAEASAEFGVAFDLPFSTAFRDSNSVEVLRTEGPESGPTVRQLTQMRRMDGQARALYRLITLPIRAALRDSTWVPADDGEAEADFVEQMFTLPPNAGGMTLSFPRVVGHMLMAVFDGFSAFEQVYWSPTTGPLKGKWTLKKLAPRQAETISFLVDEAGGFAGFRQRASFRGEFIDIMIPGHKALYYACFTGDTKVPLLDGTTVAMSDLPARMHSGEDLWTYSIKDGSIVPGRVSDARAVGRRETVYVTLDNGERIQCTPDHRFMLRDGGYQEAGSLQPGDSLMPLYRRGQPVGRTKALYEQVYVPGEEKWRFTHRMVADQLFGPGKTGWVTHHVNVNRSDNPPSNLQRLTVEQHRAVHADLCARSGPVLKRLWADPEWSTDQAERIRQALQRPEVRAKLAAFNTSEERRQARSEWMRANNSHGRRDVTFEVIDDLYRALPRSRRKIAIELGVDPAVISLRVKSAGHASWTEYTKSVGPRLAQNISDEERARRSRRMKDQLHAQWQDPTYRATRTQESSQRLAKLWQDEEWAERQRESAHAGRWNHKVVSVEPGGVEEVYDLTVDDHHNFALSAGVFVHNCNEEENPFYGSSYFESAFYHYDKKVKLYYIAHLAAQVNALGMRVGKHPKNAPTAQKAKFQRALKDFGLAQWMDMPDDWSVDVVRSGSGFDFLSFINHHNSQMSKSVLANWFDQNQGGGTSDTSLVDFGQQSDTMFMLMLQSIMDDVADLINNYVIPKFIDWNFGSGKYPKFRWGTFTDEQERGIRETFDKLAVASTTMATSKEFMHEIEKKMADKLGLEVDYQKVEEQWEKEAAQAEEMSSIQLNLAKNPPVPVAPTAGGTNGQAAEKTAPGAPQPVAKKATAKTASPAKKTTTKAAQPKRGSTQLTALARELLDAAEEEVTLSSDEEGDDDS